MSCCVLVWCIFSWTLLLLWWTIHLKQPQCSSTGNCRQRKKCCRAKVILSFACSIFSLSSSSQVHRQWVWLLGFIWEPGRSKLLHNLIISARHNLSIQNLTFFFSYLTWLLSLASWYALKSHLEYSEAVLYDKSCSYVPKLSIQIY